MGLGRVVMKMSTQYCVNKKEKNTCTVECDLTQYVCYSHRNQTKKNIKYVAIFYAVIGMVKTLKTSNYP